MYLLGFYGLFYAISIPYHRGHVTLKSFIIHVTTEAMNCPVISNIPLHCVYDVVEVIFFSTSRSHRAFYFV